MQKQYPFHPSFRTLPHLLIPGLLLLGTSACNPAQERHETANPAPSNPPAAPAAPDGRAGDAGGARPTLTPAPLAPTTLPGPAPLANPGPIEPAPLAPVTPSLSPAERNTDRPGATPEPKADVGSTPSGATAAPAPLAPVTPPGPAPLAKPGPLEPAPLAPAVESVHAAPTTAPSSSTRPAGLVGAAVPETRRVAVSFTGTLHARRATTARETTGWTLAGDGATGGLEIDVSAVAADARNLDGKHVAVTGYLKADERSGRGKSQVLVAEKVIAEPLPDLNK